jgi:hypothetical protein
LRVNIIRNGTCWAYRVKKVFTAKGHRKIVSVGDILLLRRGEGKETVQDVMNLAGKLVSSWTLEKVGKVTVKDGYVEWPEGTKPKKGAGK